jgi:hypothetical protein
MNFKLDSRYHLLIGSVMIDVELGKKNHNSIPRNYDWKLAETTQYQNRPPN